MAVDPETGIITPDVTRQPLGAMGAVLGLSNAQRASDIANTLQQSRELALQSAQTQEQQREEEIGRETKMRAALANLYAGGTPPTMQQVQGAILPYAKSPESLLPWFRGQTAAQGRVDAAKINAMGGIARSRIAGGESPQSVLASMGPMLSSPEEQEAFQQSLSGVPAQALPVPAATAGMRRSLGGLADTKAQVMLDREPAEIALDQSRASLALANGRLADAKAKNGGNLKLSSSNVNQLANIYQRALKERDAFVNRKPTIDPNTGLEKKPTPAQQAQNAATLAAMNDELEKVKSSLDLARASSPAPAAPAAGALSPKAQALMPQ